MDKQEILDVLSKVYDPDYVNRSIIDMGLVAEDDITITEGQVEVAYTLTAPMCPFSAAIGLMIKYALEKKLGVSAIVGLKAGHYQTEAVTEVLKDPEQTADLMQKPEEFGIIERCVRF